MKPYTLYISNEQLHLLQARRHRVESLYKTEHTPQMPEALASELGQALAHIPRQGRCHILLDAQEEEILFASLPKVLPWEKADAIKVRLRQTIDHTASLAYLIDELPPRPTQEKSEKQLRIFNLTRSPLLEALQEAIEQNGTLTLKCVSVTRLLEKHLRPHLPADAHMVLLENHHTLYLYAFLNRRIHLYRKLNIATEILQDSLAQELNLTIRYLYNERIVQSGTPFSFLHLHSQPSAKLDTTTLQSLVAQLQEQHHWPQNKTAALKTHPLHQYFNLPETSDLATSLTQLNRRKSTQSYPLTPIKVARTIYGLRTALWVTTASIFTAAVTGGIWLLAQQHAHQRLVPQVEAHIHQVQQAYKQLKPLINTQLNLEQISQLSKEAVTLHADIQATPLYPILKQLAQALAPYQALTPLSIQIEKATPEKASAPHAVITLKLQLSPPPLTYQKSMERINQITRHIRNQPHITEAQLIALPIDAAGTRQQPVTPDMLMPATLDFTLRVNYVWEQPQP